ncbi:MAG: gamma-glutamylcyclotransferase [Pseudomonadota bacterium]
MDIENCILHDDILFGSQSDDFWVFAYGSLMWRPDFRFENRERATLDGFERALCIYSWVHRGTREKPGLVFGLDRGESGCEGFAYKIAIEDRRDTVEKLRKRELVTAVYREMQAPVRLTGSRERSVTALFYVVDPEHEQYAGRLPRSETARFVRQGVGGSGVNLDYVLSTHDHLIEEGIDDPELSALCADLRRDGPLTRAR